jgi:hypothetical protein
MTGVLLMLFSFDANACSLAPAHHKVSPDELISRTKNIVLARVIKADYLEPPKVDKDGKINGVDEFEYIINNEIYSVKYIFEVLDLIKGESQKFFIFNAYILMDDASLNHFDRHGQEIFWENNSVGRTQRSSDCELHPSFSVGFVYLMFLDSPYSFKSFELIRNYKSDDGPNYKDKWLAYVEAKVAEQK